jgi:pimeloyl-ACP methyl ester carboxylesterase
LYEPHDIHVSPLAGLDLCGEEEGEGAPVVLLHGLTATRGQVVHGSRLLARSGQRVIAYDARGHGLSSAPESPAAHEYSDLVHDLASVLAQLSIRAPVLVGSSMGAATALAFALRQPGAVAALVQITPAYDGAPHDDPSELGRWDEMADALEREDVDGFVALSQVHRIPERFREPARVATRQRLERHRDLRAVAQAVRVVPRSEAFNGLEALKTLDLPVLVVGSRDDTDPGHPLAVAREYVRRLPRARLMVEPEGDSPLAWQGARLSRAISEFLATDGT